MRVALGHCSQVDARYLGHGRLRPFLFTVLQCPQRPCLLVDPWFLELACSEHLQVLVVHDAFADGLTYGIPVLIHERWPPSAVSRIRGVDEGSQRTFFISTGSDSWIFSKSPIFTASIELSQLMHQL